MNEDSKTLLFLAIAFVSAIFAFTVSREAPEKTAADEVGKPLVAIENPLDVTRMKIIQFDSNEGRAKPFEVAKVEGRFSIPSHENYPADESDHLVRAVTGVNNRTILSSVTDQSGNHHDFGVLDPANDQLGKGAEGVGTRVTLSDDDGADLADFIIGKKVSAADGQYYVRQAGNDQVYTVNLTPEDLSTQFEDWIERDLLKLNPLDLKTVSINDYSVITQQQPVLGSDGLQVVTIVQGVDMQSDIQLRYDQEGLDWTIKQLIAFQKGVPEEKKLTEDEELNKQRLDEMKLALDDLKIVDVHRKPEGLGNSLSKFIQSNPQAFKSLEEHGFFFRMVPASSGEKQNVLLSNNGEVSVGMAGGVEYVLRFGNVAGTEKASEESELPAGEATTAASGGGTVLRNLMVITRFNEALLEVPDYQEVPHETPPEPTAGEAAKTDQDQPTAQVNVAEDEEPALQNGAGESAEKSKASGPSEAEGNEKPGEPEEKQVSEEAAKISWQEKREQIIQNNEKKKREYEEKIAGAKKRSAELNRRFSDWYYVIPDDTYRKIHLTIKDVIKEKEKPGENQGDTSLPSPGKRDPLDQLKDIVPPRVPQ